MPADPEAATIRWLDRVAADAGLMSQRRLTTLQRQPGGLRRVTQRARARGVHLAVLTDDHGVALVAASVHPFKILC